VVFIRSLQYVGYYDPVYNFVNKITFVLVIIRSKVTPSNVNKANSVKAKAKAKASRSKAMVKASHFKDKIKVYICHFFSENKPQSR